MKTLPPDFYSDLVPGASAAGFSLGESFSSVSEKIGIAEWYGPEAPVRKILFNNTAWVGIKRRIGFGNEFLLSYRYMNEVISLYFEKSERLYRIAVGTGYHGRFNDVGVGDNIRNLEKEFSILFNDADDEFLLEKDGEILTGISLITNYRASLKDAPKQTIKFISIHDWSLR